MRRSLTAIAAGALAVALAVVTVLFYVVLSRALDADATAVLRDRAAAVAATLTMGTGPGTDPAGEESLDAGTWVFDPSGRLLESPPGSKGADAAVAALAGVTRPTRVDAGGLAVLAQPVRAPDGRTVTVVATASRRPYIAAERTALAAALALDGLVLVTVAVLSWRTVSAALAPVGQMTAAAAEWGTHGLRQRFRLGAPVDELTTLASTLDDLLDRLAASLGHERRLTAEIAHEFRTPLARMRAEAEVALTGVATQDRLRAALRSVVADTEQLGLTVDTLMRSSSDLSLGPDAAGVRRCDLQAAVDAVLEQVAAPEVTIARHVAGSPVVADAEHGLVVRALAPVVENAVRYGGGRVAISADADGHQARVRIDDAGPGFTRDECQEVFEPGVRGPAAAGTPGAGLGLPLARRLARSAGGDVVARPAIPEDPGGHVEVRFPLAPPTDPVTAISRTTAKRR